ncbi:MAG: hypothetical protein ACYTBJ_16625 [Planctomycetota bacterium]|jgi:hypothetical protein
MKKNPVTLIGIVVVCFGFGFLTSWCVLRQQKKAGLETFLDNRERVLKLLDKHFSEAPEGTTLAGRSPKSTDVLFPGSDNIRSVVRTHRWHSARNFQVALDLTEAYIALHNQSSSETCTGRKLLDHYFQDLAKLGLRNQGSPGSGRFGTDASTQHVTQRWSLDDYTIFILCDVVVDLDSKTAVIQCNVIQDY